VEHSACTLDVGSKGLVNAQPRSVCCNSISQRRRRSFVEDRRHGGQQWRCQKLRHVVKVSLRAINVPCPEQRHWPVMCDMVKSANAGLIEQPAKRKPFANWVKRITNLKGNDEQASKKKKSVSKQKKNNTHNGVVKNNPYPQSGTLRPRERSPASSVNGQLSFSTPETHTQHRNGSFDSLPSSAAHDRECQSNNNKSGAPTLATNEGTIHSDAGQSKAATTTTGGHAFSTDGAGAGSTFSSPNHSERSLTTTLTTIQSQSHGSALQNGASTHPSPHNHGSFNNPNPVMFSHQFPTSPAPSHMTASAIPRYLNEAPHPVSYHAATAGNLLTDNASILTLASSSKQRRRSMDTDASVRAIPPSSVWGGSRESLPLSILSATVETGPSTGLYTNSQSRPSMGGLASASVYSSQGVSAPALASERNSYYKSPKDFADAKSLRSINQFDSKSINDAKSMDVSSLRGYEGSTRSGAAGHSRNDSVPGSISSPLASPGVRHPSTSGALSRRSSDWQEITDDKDETDDDGTEKHNSNAQKRAEGDIHNDLPHEENK